MEEELAALRVQLAELHRRADVVHTVMSIIASHAMSSAALLREADFAGYNAGLPEGSAAGGFRRDESLYLAAFFAQAAEHAARREEDRSRGRPWWKWWS